MTSIEQGCPQKTARQTFFISLGVFFEWYDFTLYFYLGTILSSIFFKALPEHSSLFVTYAIFAVAYVCRPIGGIIFGRISDRMGRRHALLLAMKCMFIASLGIAILPSYSHIGVAASILLLIFRALQGVSIGGEYTGVLTLVFEKSRSKVAGKNLSMIGVISCLGQITSTVCVFLLMHLTSQEFMLHFGWRICFIVGSLGMAIVYYFQASVPESESFLSAKASGTLKDKPILFALKHHRLSISLVFLLTGTLGISYILYFVSIPNALIQDYQYTKSTVHLIIVLATLLQTISYPIGGYLSDKLNSTRILLFSFTFAMLTVYPCNFYMMHHFLSGGAFLYLGFVTMFSVTTPAFLLLINQKFPVYCRASGVFVGYNLSNALFCSVTPSVGIMFSGGVFSIEIASGFLIIGLAFCLLALLLSQASTKRNIHCEEVQQTTMALSES
ncbi:MAG: hypothetical protein CL816_05930 [Coxiellaceae bacterium]|nr:hypothetical protein [Coxiellaceae bacterium]